MANLAILQPDARISARLRGALEGSHRVVRGLTGEGLAEALQDGSVDGCILDLGHPDRVTAVTRAEHLRGRFPAAALIAFVDAGERAGSFHVGTLQLDGLITTTTTPARVRAAVDQAFSKARAHRIGRAVKGNLGTLGSEAFVWATERAAGQPSVGRMARELSRTGPRLRLDLAAAGCPSPSRVLLWGRLLTAGARLAEDGRNVEEVSFSLGYSTSKSLARAMKRTTGHTLREVAEGGGMDLVLRALLDELGDGGGNGIRRRALAMFLAIGVAGCAALGTGVDRAGIEGVLASPGIEQMHVGVLAVDAETGETLYERNAALRFVPASNQKILVTAAAMTMLGPDHRFRTEVWSTGPLVRGVTTGDLVVVGSGDPSLSGRFWPSGTAALEALADSLVARGLARVRGALVVDVSAWDSASMGPTREVGDLRYAYGATGGAFAIDEGEIEIVVEGGRAPGSPARVRWSPVGTDDFVESRIETADTAAPITPRFLPESRRLVLDGAVEPGVVDTLSFAIRDPVRQASAALARAIQGAGVALERGWEVRWVRDEGAATGCARAGLGGCSGGERLAVFESPPLPALVRGMLGSSQNWMTEQLLLAMAASFGERATWDQGTAVLEAFLFEHVGVDSLDVVARDGSGLSAYNLVTPRALVRVLRFMSTGPAGAAYRDAMAEPGEVGSSVEERLLDLRGRVFAKTGTISNVNSLSGYLVRDDGREVVFSILTNASGLPSVYVREAVDDIVRALSR